MKNIFIDLLAFGAIWLILCSVILLLAMVAPIFISRTSSPRYNSSIPKSAPADGTGEKGEISAGGYLKNNNKAKELKKGSSFDSRPKKFINSVKKGLIKGYKIQPLPDNINNFINNKYIRILRVIGGISIILSLSKKYLLLPLELQYVVLCFALIQFIQITIISLIKTIFIIKKLIYNPEDFEVRNSPLDKYAMNIAKLVSCWKSACNFTATGTGIMGTGFLVDQVLEVGGQDKVFEPYLKKLLNSVVQEKRASIASKANGIKTDLFKIRTSEEQLRFVKEEIADKCDDESLVNQGLTQAEAKEVRSAILSMVEASEAEKKAFVQELMAKVTEYNDNDKVNKK